MKDKNNAIEAEGISKKFDIKYTTFYGGQAKSGTKTVLDGMSFSIRKGEVVGIVGRNGSGKSTLMKILSGIMGPDSGTVNVNGKVASILELGMGFEPEMTGRDNIRIKCSMYGFTEKDIDQQMESIIQFSELGEQVDHPLRTYSSGMTAKLAFSVIMHTTCNVMIVDEVLSVGDASFNAKCRMVFQKMKKEGRAILIASHSMETLESMCDRVMWIDEGKVREMGDPSSVCYHFFSDMVDSFDTIIKLAEEGDVISMNRSAVMLRDGIGVQKDEKRAVDLFTKAANMGHTDSQMDLADMKLKAGDKKSALALYKKAANDGNYKAITRLTVMDEDNAAVSEKLMKDVRSEAEAGNIQFYFMDGNNNGSLFFDYLKCDPRTLELFNGKLFVTGSEIESILVKLQQEYNEIDQNLRKGDPIDVFNATHPKSSIPYRVVIIDSFPKGINATYIPVITKLVKNEIAAGLHFVFLVEEQDISRISELADLTTVFSIKPNLRKLDTSLLSRGVLDYVSKAYNQEKAMLFEEYYDSNVDWWKDTTANYTIIPLGMHRAVNYNLTFNEEGKDSGVSSANAVIVGMPGSGKSCLLHTMIVGSSIKYSPNELRFYMIDLKAVEFKQYEVERLPHAEFVALKANPEFGFHILQVICKKIKEREQLFNQRQVKNYLGYRNAFPDDVLPRYMIFIDEYQELLRGDLRPAVISRLDFIIRVGRALGFNLILSSQTMDLPAELVGLISHRIAMRSTTAAARSVLDFYDERAPQLNTGQAIVHAETTDLVQSYYLPEDAKGKPANATKLRADYLKLIREKWELETQGKYEHNLVVFDREMPALLSNNKAYKKMSVVKEAYDVFFSPGEKIMIDGEDLMCKFTRMRNDNLMVLGGKADVSVRTLNGCLMSMLPQLDPKDVGIDIVNLLNLSQASLYHEIENSSRFIKDKFVKACYTTDSSDINALFDDILSDIKQRTAKLRSGEYVAPRFLVIYRTENDMAFHEIVTQSYGMESSEKSELTNKLLQILGTGPEVGIHSLVHFNDPASFFVVLDAKSNDKHFFNHRLLLQMQEEESKHFLDSFSRKDASELVDKEASEKFAYNLALYYNAYDQNEPVKIKPYEFININQ